MRLLILCHRLLSLVHPSFIYLGNINLDLYTYILYIDFFICIFIQSNIIAETYQTHMNQAIMVRGQKGRMVNRTQIYTATVHYITTQYATGATAQYSDAASSTWQPASHKALPLMAWDINVATTRLSIIMPSKWQMLMWKHLDRLNQDSCRSHRIPLW